MKKLIGDDVMVLLAVLGLMFLAVALAYAHPKTVGAGLCAVTALYLLAQVPYRQVVSDLTNYFKS